MNGPATVLVLTNAPAPYVQDLADAVRSGGNRCALIARHDPREIGRDWIVTGPDIVVTSSEPRDFVTVLGHLVGDHRAHLILTGGYASFADTLRRALTAAAPTASVHFWGEQLRGGPRKPALRRRCWFGAPGLDGILAIGSRAARSYRTVVRDSLPVHVFPYTAASGLGVPHEPGAEPTIGFAGRLLPYKGVDALLEGISSLPAAKRPTLEIAGTGPDQPRLVHLSRALGVAGRVEWLGSLSGDALARRRRRWWAQAVPSRAIEGWGVVVNEALNSGVPVLASDLVNSAVDLLRDPRAGVVVPTARLDSGHGWARAIESMCDRSALDERSRAARAVGEAFAPSQAARWLVQLLWDRPSHPRSFVEETWELLGTSRATRS